MIDDLTELAAQYHRDKLNYILNYPSEFVSGRDGISRETFDYFPEHYYEQGFKQLRDQVSDATLDEWIDEIVGKEPIGCEHGGLWRDDIPQLVADILTSSQRYETEITIRPEHLGDGYDTSSSGATSTTTGTTTNGNPSPRSRAVIWNRPRSR